MLITIFSKRGTCIMFESPSSLCELVADLARVAVFKRGRSATAVAALTGRLPHLRQTRAFMPSSEMR